MPETKEIPFYDDTILGIKDEKGYVWLAIAHTCKELGFNERRIRQQGEKIRIDKVLSKGVRKFRLPTNGGEQDTYCLNEKFVPLWVAKITLTKKMQEDIPDVFNKLEKYQLEAADVLHRAFYETSEQKEKLHTDLNIKGDISDLKFKFAEVHSSIKHHSNVMERIEKLMVGIIDTSTINTYQQQKLYKIAKDRINFLLDGAHSQVYKYYAKSYFINLWNDFKKRFSCGSYKDLNPIYFEDVKNFINEWEYRFM